MAVKPKTTGEMTKVRVVAMGSNWPVNAVVKLSAAEAKAAVDGGWGDDDPAAVAYAESLAESPAEEA
jgi:hypothetical protein